MPGPYTHCAKRSKDPNTAKHVRSCVVPISTQSALTSEQLRFTWQAQPGLVRKLLSAKCRDRNEGRPTGHLCEEYAALPCVERGALPRTSWNHLPGGHFCLNLQIYLFRVAAI